MKMRYSLIPSRAVGDCRITHGAFRTLASLCLFTRINGICFPNQTTLADIRGVRRAVVTQQMNQLRMYGYVVDLEPVGKKHPKGFKRGNRYFVPTFEQDQPPPLEIIRFDDPGDCRRPPYVYI